MRILSCHIENFGKLHDYSADFSEGVNIVCEENGWGKSTFAAFVRAMFYGLGGSKKKNAAENERKKYKPWQGGVFGGQLTFEIQEKTYQISRVFHDKESNDEFELRDVKTNLPSADYTENIGKEIFKIDRDSFIRTIFIGQSDCETSSTGDINAKIGNLADNSNDLNNFDKAHKRLTDMIKGLKSPSRSSVGSLNQRADEITRYEQKVRDGMLIAGSIESYQKKLNAEEADYEELKLKIREVGALQQKASKLQSVIAKKSEWNRLKNNFEDRKLEASELRKKFPGEVPSMPEVEQKIGECGAMENAAAKASAYQLSEQEELECITLSKTFSKGLPEKAVIDEMIKDAGDLAQLRQECAQEQLSADEERKLGQLDARFLNENEDVDTIADQWNQRNAKNTALPSNQAALVALKASLEPKKSKSKKISPLLIAGAILAVCGVIVAVALSLIAGLLVAVLGAVILVVGLIMGRKKPEHTGAEQVTEITQLSQRIEQDIAYIKRTDEKMKAYFEQHGKVFTESNAAVILHEITKEFIEYSDLKAKAEKAARSNKMSEINHLSLNIAGFIGQYGIEVKESKYSEELYSLKHKMDRLETLDGKKRNFQEEQQKYREIFEEIIKFLEQYKYVPNGEVAQMLSEIRTAVDDYQDANKALENAAKELEQFEKETEIAMLENEEADDELPAPEELSTQIQQLTDDKEEIHRRITRYNQNLEELQEAYDEWEENKRMLETLKALQMEEFKKHDALQKAREKLELAKEIMTAKYSDPILKGFSKYYEMITGTSAESFHVDAHTKVTVDELGKQRETNLLSSGYRDLIGICLRIALVDAMYQEEAPVLIMDDPFTNLDDHKISEGRVFLDELAEKYQVIYFTCSQSRC